MGQRHCIAETRHTSTAGAYQFRLSTLFFLAALMAVVLSGFAWNGRLGGIMAVVLVPATLATCVLTVRRRSRGEPVTFVPQARWFARTIVWIMVGGYFAMLAAAAAGIVVWMVHEGLLR